jgi:hypothetical protein
MAQGGVRHAEGDWESYLLDHRRRPSLKSQLFLQSSPHRFGLKCLSINDAFYYTGSYPNALIV